MTFESCIECGSFTMLYDKVRGEIICKTCGLVANNVLSYNPEWRAFNTQEERARSRIGSPSSILNLNGLSTKITRINLDYYGKYLDMATRTKFARLSRINNRIQYKTIRNLKKPVLELKRLRSLLNISDDVLETAFIFYCLTLKKDLIRGRSVIGMIGASIYLACRRKRVPITLKDLLEVLDITFKQLKRCTRIYLKNINISNIYIDPVILINRIGDKLGLTMRTRTEAAKILIKAREKGLTIGKKPMALVGAAIYIASIQTGEKRTQRQIAKVAQITPVTIRNRVKTLIHGLKVKNFDVKRGAAEKAVIIKDPIRWI